jgi:hypothetical protein
VYLITKYFSEHQIKQGEMDSVCGTYEEAEKVTQNFGGET